jgi:hypothetical protein
MAFQVFKTKTIVSCKGIKVAWFFIIVGIFVVLCIIGAISESNKSSPSQPTISPRPTPPSLEDALVRWQTSQTGHPDLNELLKSHIGMRDLVTSELLCPGDEVYFCSICKLSHLKKSWEFMNHHCERNDCRGNEVARPCMIPLNMTWKNLP